MNNITLELSSSFISNLFCFLLSYEITLQLYYSLLYYEIPQMR